LLQAGLPAALPGSVPGPLLPATRVLQARVPGSVPGPLLPGSGSVLQAGLPAALLRRSGSRLLRRSSPQL
jgi:hypothetical protein